MSRSAPIIPVDAKMYRHFAIATVLITGCLAMFASGENREALENKIEARQRYAEAQQAQQQSSKPKAIGKKGNFTDSRKVQGSFSNDSDMRWRPPPSARKSSGYAETSQAELVAAGSTSAASSSASFDGSPPPGMSAEQYAQSVADKENGKKKKKVRKKMSQSELDAMMAASKARSQTRRD